MDLPIEIKKELNKSILSELFACLFLSTLMLLTCNDLVSYDMRKYEIIGIVICVSFLMIKTIYHFYIMKQSGFVVYEGVVIEKYREKNLKNKGIVKLDNFEKITFNLDDYNYCNIKDKICVVILNEKVLFVLKR